MRCIWSELCVCKAQIKYFSYPPQKFVSNDKIVLQENGESFHFWLFRQHSSLKITKKEAFSWCFLKITGV